MIELAAALLIAYLLGSIPTGLWLGKAFKGIDIREHGSKNIGATNTLRVLGKGYGALALSGDIGKGVLAVVVGMWLASTYTIHAPLLCGVTAIVGHSASIFCRFKGGKGVATSTGVFLALAPVPTLLAAGVFFAVVLATRMVSAGSIAAAITLGIAVWFFPDLGIVVQGLTTAVAVLVVARHHSNIGRILRGEENKF
jgi:glycerol-3-phosphate acyltransferase PlsY